MEDNTKGFLQRQIQETQKVLTDTKGTPETDRSKAALKALTTYLSELRKDEELALKIEKEKFEMEIKREAEKHRMEIENLDSDIRFRESNSKIELAEKEFDHKVNESKQKLKQEGLLSTIKFGYKAGLMLLGYRLESAGTLLNWNLLNADKKLE